MTESVFHKLDRDATNYLLTELSFANPLGKRFATTSLLETGQTFAVLPTNGYRDPHGFKTSIFAHNSAPRIPVEGGVIQEVPSTEPFVADWIAKLFRSHPSLALLSESYLWRRADVEYTSRQPTIASQAHGDLVSGDFVYRLALAEDPPDRVRECLDYVYGVPASCAVLWDVRDDRRAALVQGIALNEEALNWAADGLRALVLGAYDGESVLVWTPGDTALISDPE